MRFEIPRVTCITTTYKKFYYLFETLDSIFMQDYPNIEIILGDDGSDNFPEKKITEYIEREKGANIKNVVIIRHKENHGTVYNCRSCRDAASGEYIFGIASDDRFVDEHVLSDVVAYFNKTGAEVVTCKRQFIENGTDKKLVCMPFDNQITWMKKLSSDKLFEKLASFCFLSGASTYYRRSLYESVGGYDSSYKYMEDYPFYLKLLRNGKKINIYDRVTILYRFGDGISTTSHKKNILRESMYADRIRYMEQDIIPYMKDFSWWRKEQMKVRLKRFYIEERCQEDNLFKVYVKLFLYSPIGTIIQLWYLGIYKARIKLLSRK